MKIGNFPRITLDDVASRPQGVVQKYNALCDILESVLQGGVNSDNLKGRTLEIDLTNGVPQNLNSTVKAQGIDVLQWTPLTADFQKPSLYWKPSINGLELTAWWDGSSAKCKVKLFIRE